VNSQDVELSEYPYDNLDIEPTLISQPSTLTLSTQVFYLSEISTGFTNATAEESQLASQDRHKIDEEFPL